MIIDLERSFCRGKYLKLELEGIGTKGVGGIGGKSCGHFPMFAF